jgi:D-alanine transaminase
MKNLGYYCGKFGLLDEMTVPMNDRVCYFGDGVYDATYTANYKIYDLEEHIDRFYSSAALLDINITKSKDELKDLLQEMVNKVDSPEQFLYWQVTRGTSVRNHVPEPGVPSNLWIMIKPGTIKDVYNKIKLISVEDTRYFHCNIKTLNLLPNVMASQKAAAAGCDEVVFKRGERVTECAHSNISILTNGILKTAPLDNLILPGITRGHLIKNCIECGISVEEVPYTLKELMDADEIIVTSAGSLCIGVSEVDGIAVGGKDPETLKMLQDLSLKNFNEATKK